MPMLFRTASIIFGTLLRAAGDTKTPMKIGVLVNLTNVVLNFLLIYQTRELSILGITFIMPGAGLGVIGAAIASAIAFTVGGICITIVLWRHPLVSPRGKSFRPDMKILKPCLTVAFPNMLQRFGTSLGYVFFASMINSIGEVATAAHTIANTVESAFYIPGYGMQTAAATLAGNAYGANDKKRMDDDVSGERPSLSEVKQFWISEGLKYVKPSEFWGYYNVKHWRDKENNPVHNWKALARSWNERNKRLGNIAQ